MRAELGVGNVDAALSLLERIKARFVTFDFYFFSEFLFYSLIVFSCQTIPRSGV